MFKLFVSSGLYGLWSHIYRTIWEHKYSHITLPIVESVEELAAIAAKMEWTADGWKHLRDAVSSPEAVWD